MTPLLASLIGFLVSSLLWSLTGILYLKSQQAEIEAYGEAQFKNGLTSGRKLATKLEPLAPTKWPPPPKPTQ